VAGTAGFAVTIDGFAARGLRDDTEGTASIGDHDREWTGGTVGDRLDTRATGVVASSG